MQENVKVTFWILLLCVGCFLTTWNLRLIWSDSSGVLLALSPENIEFQLPFSEGSEFQAKFTLENKTHSDLIVKKIMSSCGCTGLFTKEGKPIETPMILTPLKLFPVLVTVDANDMEGKRCVSVMVLYEHRGQPLFSVGNIFFEVLRQKAVDKLEY